VVVVTNVPMNTALDNAATAIPDRISILRRTPDPGSRPPDPGPNEVY